MPFPPGRLGCLWGRKGVTPSSSRLILGLEGSADPGMSLWGSRASSHSDSSPSAASIASPKLNGLQGKGSELRGLSAGIYRGHGFACCVSSPGRRLGDGLNIPKLPHPPLSPSLKGEHLVPPPQPSPSPYLGIWNRHQGHGRPLSVSAGSCSFLTSAGQ